MLDCLAVRKDVVLIKRYQKNENPNDQFGFSSVCVLCVKAFESANAMAKSSYVSRNGMTRLCKGLVIFTYQP